MREREREYSNNTLSHVFYSSESLHQAKTLQMRELQKKILDPFGSHF
jgi:hypothetical protein